jgi:hypothetical protein
VFEIYADGEWKQAAYLSENFNEDGETKYWRLETIDLNEYAGKKVQFRWINRALSGRHNGASLDEVVINGTIEDGVAFNHESWDAGQVNYLKGNNSGSLLTVRNSGKNDLKVKSATFGTQFFQLGDDIVRKFLSRIGDELRDKVCHFFNLVHKQSTSFLTYIFQFILSALQCACHTTTHNVCRL